MNAAGSPTPAGSGNGHRRSYVVKTSALFDSLADDIEMRYPRTKEERIFDQIKLHLAVMPYQNTASIGGLNRQLVIPEGSGVPQMDVYFTLAGETVMLRAVHAAD